MDGFSQSDGIIVIAATNLPDSLDKALVRPGRFDRHVAVPLPDVRGRMAILRHHARNVPYDVNKVDMSVIARATPGYSGAELEALVNQVRSGPGSASNSPPDERTGCRQSFCGWLRVGHLAALRMGAGAGAVDRPNFEYWSV